MIPGPYSLCHATFPAADSDAAIYRTLRYGYDTAGNAFHVRAIVAREFSVPEDEIVVLRVIDAEEQAEFAR
jgi:hypothetical protein